MDTRCENKALGKAIQYDYWLSSVKYQGRIRCIRTSRPLDEWNIMGKHTAPEANCPTCNLPNGNHDLQKHRLGLDPESTARREAMNSGRHPAGKGRHTRG